MDHTTQPEWFENEVRIRSHAIWEAEGHKDGYSEEHWMRAIRDIEDACRTAQEGKNADYSPPQLVVSELPIRSVAE